MKYNHPNFFIVGAGKSGTTSLWSCLRQHPQVYMPELKEPSFFSFHYKHNLTYEEYLFLFSRAIGKKAIGEASHAYLTSPESAELIKKKYPDAKLIIILRNPVERAFSLYQWMTREGYEWIYPFEKALEAEDERIKSKEFHYKNPQYYYNYLYYSSGLYSGQIERYLNSFPSKQIKFFIFDDLKEDISRIIKQTYFFLEVDNDFTPNSAIKNKMRYPLFIYGQFFLKKRMDFVMKKIFIPRMARKRIVRYAMDTNIFLGSIRKELLLEKTKEKLLSLYKDDIKKTEVLIKRDLSNWLSVS